MRKVRRKHSAAGKRYRISRGRIYIAADKQRQERFVQCVSDVAEREKFDSFFPPWHSGGPSYETLVDKALKYIATSKMIIMDVTPQRIGGTRHINPGVLIEFGIVVALRKLRQLSLFAEKGASLEEVHPFIKGKEVIRYSAHESRELSRLILREIDLLIAAAEVPKF